MFDNDFDPQLGVHDMRVGEDYLPPQVAKKVNGHIACKGGSQPTSQSGLDPTFKPFYERGLGKVEGALDRGEFSRVAHLDPSQQEGLYAQEQLGRDALTGQGYFDTEGLIQRDLRNVAGQAEGQASNLGALGSARAQAAANQAVANRALDLRTGQQERALQGAGLLQQAGATRQEQAQREADAVYQGLQRAFGIAQSAPTTTSTSGGGGGK